jgi:hypothetical protein
MMAATDDLYRRSRYAQELAAQLLRPTPLHTVVRSGVFLAGIRRVGKTTFLRQDLVPALEALGALVIYADLWADRSKSPHALVNEVVRTALGQLAAPGSGLLKRLKGLNLGAAGLSLGFQVEQVGAPGGTTLAQAFEAVVSQAQVDVVLIVDEVQQALATEDGGHLLHALKAARDAVNARPGMPGTLIVLGTGSHKSLITDMTTRRAQPFTGAVTAAYEVLGPDFVRWQLDRIAASPGVALPSAEVAWAGFQALGHRPEELLKALVQLQATPAPADAAFPIICATLASAAADTELRAVEDFGNLGRAVFAFIAAGREEGVSGLFGAEALAFYRQQLGGLGVEPSQVQNMADRLIAANLIARPSHGVYAVADPFVRQVWQQRAALRLNPAPGSATPAR